MAICSWFHENIFVCLWFIAFWKKVCHQQVFSACEKGAFWTCYYDKEGTIREGNSQKREPTSGSKDHTLSFFHVLGSPLYLMPIYTCTKGNVYLLLSRKGPLHKISIRFCNSWNMLWDKVSFETDFLFQARDPFLMSNWNAHHGIWWGDNLN